MAAASSRGARLGRLERPALTGVLVREVVNYSSYWKSIDVLLDGRADDLPARVRLRLRLARLRRSAATTTSTSSGRGRSRRRCSSRARSRRCSGRSSSTSSSARTTRSSPRPSTRRSSSRAEALWIATRAGVYGCVPMLVAMVFGLDPSWGMLARAAHRAGSRASAGPCFGVSVAGFSKSFENFNYVVSAVLTPLFLLAGSFFPLDEFPRWAQILARLQPAAPLRRARPRTPCSASRAGRTSPASATLVLFGLIVWRVAIRAMTRKLID